MDRIFEAKLLALIDRKLTERLEGADEVWLKPKQLLEQFGMLSQEWLDRNGELLPREYASVILPDGEVQEATIRTIIIGHTCKRQA